MDRCGAAHNADRNSAYAGSADQFDAAVGNTAVAEPLALLARRAGSDGFGGGGEARYQVESGNNFYRVEITLPYVKVRPS